MKVRIVIEADIQQNKMIESKHNGKWEQEYICNEPLRDECLKGLVVYEDSASVGGIEIEYKEEHQDTDSVFINIHNEIKNPKLVSIECVYNII